MAKKEEEVWKGPAMKPNDELLKIIAAEPLESVNATIARLQEQLRLAPELQCLGGDDGYVNQWCIEAGELLANPHAGGKAILEELRELRHWQHLTKCHAPYEAAGATWELRHERDQQQLATLTAAIERVREFCIHEHSKLCRTARLVLSEGEVLELYEHLLELLTAAPASAGKATSEEPIDIEELQNTIKDEDAQIMKLREMLHRASAGTEGTNNAEV